MPSKVLLVSNSEECMGDLDDYIFSDIEYSVSEK